MKWRLLALSCALPCVLAACAGMSLPFVIAATLCGLMAFFAGVIARAGEP